MNLSQILVTWHVAVVVLMLVSIAVATRPALASLVPFWDRSQRILLVLLGLVLAAAWVRHSVLNYA